MADSWGIDQFVFKSIEVVLLKTGYYDFVINVFHDVKHWRRCTDLADLMVEAGLRVLIVTNSRDAFNLIRRNTVHEVIDIKSITETMAVGEDVESEWRSVAGRHGLDQSVYRFVEIECVQNFPAYRSKPDMISYVIKLFKAYEELFADVKVKCFFQLLASDIERRVFFLAGKRIARHSFQYTQSVIPDREIFFVGEDGFADAVFLKKMELLIEPDEDLSENIKKEMGERKRKGKYLARRQWTLKDSFMSLYAIRERLWNARKTEYLLRNFRRFMFVPLRKRIWKFFSNKFVPGEKYLFYPMHAPGEDTVIVRGFPHLDEMALIKIISMSLPAGYKLYVKEHPGWEGWQTLCELRRLREIEEVRLIESATDSHFVINNSEGCVVLNSSVWFESLMLAKPVICIGTGIFTGLGVVREVSDLRALDREIASMIGATPDRRGLDRFLNVMSDLSYDGVYHYPQSCSDLTRKLFKALILHLEKIEDLSSCHTSVLSESHSVA